MFVNVCGFFWVFWGQILCNVCKGFTRSLSGPSVWNKTYDPSCQPISSREWKKYYPLGHDELLGHRSVSALLKL